MVCLPCFIVPLLLYIFHKFIQPLLLRFWNPWEKKDAQGNVIKGEPKPVFDCKDGVCTFSFGRKKATELNGTQEKTAPKTIENKAEGGTEGISDKKER